MMIILGTFGVLGTLGTLKNLPSVLQFRKLLEMGVIVRPVVGYGLPAHIRVTVGLPEENERFIEALSQILDK